jgi:DNA-binding NarL/FixJ family response regulator
MGRGVRGHQLFEAKKAKGKTPMTKSLSSREREVLTHFGQGLTYSQIAHRMGIAFSTVDTYLRRVRVKSGAASSAELVRLAMSLEAAAGARGEEMKDAPGSRT